jgi:hypothetical protein
MRANWEAMFAGIPDFHAEICRSVQDGDTAWSEWRWSGNRSDGQTFNVRRVTLFEITDGQIVAGRLYLEDVERNVVGIEQTVEALAGSTDIGSAIRSGLLSSSASCTAASSCAAANGSLTDSSMCPCAKSGRSLTLIDSPVILYRPDRPSIRICAGTWRYSGIGPFVPA